ncbi:MAG: HNH endonuclease [Gemmatimonadota bacterium]|nr:HNH endonuclease [Gemmatimonadota bacterium]
MSPARRSSSRRGGRRRKAANPYAADIPGPDEHLTSLPTGRRSYVDTREWLIDRHGAVCAYCGHKTRDATITLDHVTPRRGQTAYDRRDNLVLCCRPCNAKKADQPILAFLLHNRSRAINLLTYGDHLSAPLLEMIHQIAGPEAVARAERLKDPEYPYRD